MDLSEKKKVFRCGILWNWNRHVQLKHSTAAQPDAPKSGSDISSDLESCLTQPEESSEQAAKFPQQVDSGKQLKRAKKRAQPAALPAAHATLRLPAKATKPSGVHHNICNSSSTVGDKEGPHFSTNFDSNEIIPKSLS